MSSITYGDFERALQEAGSGVETAEAHGCLCGALCVQQGFAGAEWAAEVLPDDTDESLVGPLIELLSSLRDETLAVLDGEDMDFQPMLPRDTDPLEARVSALAAWCSGFLYGLGRSGALDQPSGDLDEILRDFSEIARATAAAGETGDEAERDYMELVEFVRASVLLAFAELTPQRARSAPASGSQH
jgi:uncharacterized protein YgfB (UPF0149 family)